MGVIDMANIWEAIICVVLGFFALVITVQQFIYGYMLSGYIGAIITIGFFVLAVVAAGGND
jgi:hypothetical protein